MDTTTRPHNPGPVAAGERSVAPDVARGLMLALIAMANVMIYLHGRPYGIRQHVIEDGLLDRVVTGGLVTLVDARAYPLFAALFGYGLARIAMNQRARGLDDAAITAVVRRRSWLLLALGLLHAALAFSGDILGTYGLIGVVLAGRLQVSDRTLLRVAVWWLVVGSAVQGFINTPAGVSEQRANLWSFAIENPAEAAGFRMLEWVMTPVGMVAVVSPVLIGLWAGRRRVLDTPHRHAALLRRTAVVGIAAGVLGGVGLGLATVQVWTPPFAVVAALSWLHIATGVLCGLGYAALVGLWAVRQEYRAAAPDSRVVGALRAAGERSLSCYLAQTVVFAVLLPAWSLGWGRDLAPAGAAALGLAAWAATVVAADVHARAGRRGPAEALLRRLTYGRPR